MPNYSDHVGLAPVDEGASTGDVDTSKSHLSMGQLLAIVVPIASVISSVAWAISVHAIIRENRIARVELARLALESKKYEYYAREHEGSK